MTRDEHYKRVRELFDQSHELPLSERRDFLDQACGADQVLLDEVLKLLESDARADGFLDQSISAMHAANDPIIGASIGSYQIEALIATGGMGTVYRARQDHPARAVALKLIRHGAVTPQVLRRFELEAEALGRLDHPGIAQIFEASTTQTERGIIPFFAMELVHGLQLTRYAADHGLGVRERVEILVKVCDAVHHAHQNGIIHRDLKPGNILVREDGRPKVLDFGVARITDADVQATTLLTDSGLIIGTLSYMSPEQVRGSHAELDIRADIYALGVVGYELLTGRLPLDLVGKTVAEAALMIENDVPAPLSKTGSPCAPDLQTIIAACLEKDKGRRYDSAAALAADLRRFLDDEPILARPPSVMYQLSKFARRNRALVIGSTLALTALVVGLAISIAGWTSANRERARAETEAAKATLLNTYLTDMLQAPDPWLDGREVKVVDVLARASRTLEESLSDQPEVAAVAHHRLGYTYMDLGQYDEAENHMLRALALMDGAEESSIAAEIEMLADLGYVYIAKGKLEEAERRLTEATQKAEALLEPTNPERIKTEHQLAILRWEQGALDQAEELFRSCLQQSLASMGPDNLETIVTTAALGNVLQLEGKLDEAKPLLERALAWHRENSGDDHPSTAIVVNNLAFVYQQLEQHERALDMFQRSLATRENVHAHDSTSVMVGLNNIGLQLGLMDRAEEALPHLEEAVSIAHRILEPNHWRLYAVRSTYGRTLMNAERYDEAEREMLAAFKGLRHTAGEDHWRTQKLCGNLAGLYKLTGNTEREEHFRSLIQEEK